MRKKLKAKREKFESKSLNKEYSEFRKEKKGKSFPHEFDSNDDEDFLDEDT